MILSVSPRTIWRDPYTSEKRHWTDQTTENVIVHSLAYDMSKYGNLLPVQVLPKFNDPIHRWTIRNGFRRLEAAKLILQGFEWMDCEGILYTISQPDFKLNIVLFKGDGILCMSV